MKRRCLRRKRPHQSAPSGAQFEQMSTFGCPLAPCGSIRWIRFRSTRDGPTTAARLRGCESAVIPGLGKGSEARAHALRSRSGDHDAFGRGTHGTSEGAQIKAGLILLKKREDHGRVAVRAKRALIASFAVENEGTERLSIDASLSWAGAR